MIVSVISVIQYFIQYQSTVRTNAPKTIVHKVKTHYGPGWRNSDDFNEVIDRGLTAIELKRVMDALENQSSKYDPKTLAISNV